MRCSILAVWNLIVSDPVIHRIGRLIWHILVISYIKAVIQPDVLLNGLLARFPIPVSVP